MSCAFPTSQRRSRAPKVVFGHPVLGIQPLSSSWSPSSAQGNTPAVFLPRGDKTPARRGVHAQPELVPRRGREDGQRAWIPPTSLRLLLPSRAETRM